MKKRFMLLSLTTLVGLFGCNSGLLSSKSYAPLASLAPLTPAHPLFKNGLSSQNLPLLARYYVVQEIQQDNNGQRSLRDEANYGNITYKPRQSKLVGYAGWDQIDLGWRKGDNNRADWLRLQINRPAKVVVAYEKKPLWLSGWSEGDSVMVDGKSKRTFTKDYSAGEFALGAPDGAGQAYSVLIAEAGGTPSSEPPLPANQTEVPLPNTACPSWLHNLWGAAGPDGVIYNSWHPQIDPVYWCRYGHEHGSDPSLVKYKPAFEYVAQRFNNQPELHVGFKGFAIKDDSTGLGWYVNIHSETGVQGRACARFHTVVISAIDQTTGILQAELAYKGDFGATVSNGSDGSGVPDNTPADLTCSAPKHGGTTTQAEIQAQTNSSKKLRISDTGLDPHGYENWHGGGNTNLGMLFSGSKQNSYGRAFNIDIRNPGTFCAAKTCDSVSATDGNGDERTINFAGIRIRYDDAVKALDEKDGTADGYLWTDLYGDPLADGVEPGSAGSIRQFVRPGFDSGATKTLSGSYTTEDAWRGIYLPGMGVPHIGLEGGLTIDN